MHAVNCRPSIYHIKRTRPTVGLLPQVNIGVQALGLHVKDALDDIYNYITAGTVKLISRIVFTFYPNSIPTTLCDRQGYSTVRCKVKMQYLEAVVDSSRPTVG